MDKLDKIKELNTQYKLLRNNGMVVEVKLLTNIGDYSIKNPNVISKVLDLLIRESQKQEKTASAPPVRTEKKAAANLKALQRDQNRVEQRMLELQTAKDAFEAQLASLASPQEIGEIGLRMQALDEELARQEERWLALSEEIDAATNPG